MATTTARVPASHALIIPCPPGIEDPAQLLEQLIDAAADGGEYREKSTDRDCPACIRNPGTGIKTLCTDCQQVQAARDQHDRLYRHLTEFADKRAGAL